MKDKNDLCDVVAATKALLPPDKTGCRMAALSEDRPSDVDQLLLFQVLNGVGIGMIYFLLSVGLTLIFGLMRFVKLRSRCVLSRRRYITYAVFGPEVSGGAVAWGPSSSAILALVIERLLLRHTYALPHEAQILNHFCGCAIDPGSRDPSFTPLGHNVPVPARTFRIVFLGPYVYPPTSAPESVPSRHAIHHAIERIAAHDYGSKPAAGATSTPPERPARRQARRSPWKTHDATSCREAPFEALSDAGAADRWRRRESSSPDASIDRLDKHTARGTRFRKVRPYRTL